MTHASSSNTTTFTRKGEKEAGDGALFGIINMIIFKLFIKHPLLHHPRP